jgi:hypothetical protein
MTAEFLVTSLIVGLRVEPVDRVESATSRSSSTYGAS